MKSPEPEKFSLRDVGLELAVVGVAFSMSPSVALYVPLVKSGKCVGKQPYISEGFGRVAYARFLGRLAQPFQIPSET